MAKAKQIKTKKKKKVSIREFVSEDSLKFQLYYLKLANQLKRIDDMETDTIIEKWEYDTNKKVNRFTNDKSKAQMTKFIQIKNDFVSRKTPVNRQDNGSQCSRCSVKKKILKAVFT